MNTRGRIYAHSLWCLPSRQHKEENQGYILPSTKRHPKNKIYATNLAKSIDSYKKRKYIIVKGHSACGNKPLKEDILLTRIYLQEEFSNKDIIFKTKRGQRKMMHLFNSLSLGKIGILDEEWQTLSHTVREYIYNEHSFVNKEDVMIHDVHLLCKRESWPKHQFHEGK